MIPLFTFWLLAIPTSQSPHIFSNKDFLVTYTVETSEQHKKIVGTVVEAKSKLAVEGINIWVECRNKDGTRSGTVPTNEGKFELTIPKECKAVNFLKIGFERFQIDL